VGITAWAATDVIGLPDWVLPGSLGVMFAGLPVIGTTAFVQRAAHKAYATTPQRTPGGGVPAAGTLATLALKASPHVSWRRTWMGGGIAVGAFAVLVVGFMVTRAFGIGPAASLRSKGAFGDKETVVVADFRAPVADSTLGPTVAEALRTDLAQSSSLNVLTRATVRDILGLMQRPSESVVPFDLAREIATREGAKAVLDGEIVRLGQSYVVSARLVSALDGQELATFRETADNEDALIGALGKLSRSIREKAGESLRTIRASSELERVTTPSLAALRKYVEGSHLADEAGETDRGLALLEEAVTLDTAFAMAWRKMAVLLGNEERDRTRRLAAVATAFRHRGRLTEMERMLTEGYYYTAGPQPDHDKALTAYEDAIRLDSLNTSALNNAAVVHGQRREHERAEELYQRVIRLPRTFGGAFTNLIQEQIRNGHISGLDSTVAAFRARFPESNDLWEAEIYAAWGKGDVAAADSIGRAVYSRARTVRQATRSAYAVAALALLQGRPRDGLRWLTLRTEVLSRTAPAPLSRLTFALDTALVAALQGDDRRGRAAIAAALKHYPIDSIPPGERPWSELEELGSMLADSALTRRALTGFDRDLAPLFSEPKKFRALYVGDIAMVEGRWDEAIQAYREADALRVPYARYVYVQLGRAYDRAGLPDSAIVYLEKFLVTPDPQPTEDANWRASVYRWLAELYEAKGAAPKAIEQYDDLLALWKNAEPELQPQIKEIRGRVEKLRAKVG
jgi:tetratricopeptide (TPR) repeat protein